MLCHFDFITLLSFLNAPWHLEGVITPFLTCQPSKESSCEHVLCCVAIWHNGGMITPILKGQPSKETWKLIEIYITKVMKMDIMALFGMINDTKTKIGTCW